MSNSSRGFTLIELLVVIAIIGILSSVVVASLMLGRLKAGDSAIQADLHSIQSQMELYNASHSNTYGTTYSSTSALTPSTVPSSGTSALATDSIVNSAFKDALAQGAVGYFVVGKNGASWAAAVRLRSDTNYWWCVDSSGKPVREPSSAVTTSSNWLTGGALATSADAICP